MQPRFDWILLVLVALLGGIGLVLLHSINFRDPALAEGFEPSRQVVAFLLGLGLLLAASRVDYRLWLRLAPVWYAVGVLLLIILLYVGEEVFGATRSIQLGLFDFQPTEVAKLGLIFILGRLFATQAAQLYKLRYLALSIGLLLGVAIFVALQPDIGSVAVLGFVWLLMTMMSKVSKRQLALVVVIALAISPMVIAELEPYQQQRIETFLSPGSDPEGTDYNIEQATIAVGSGQLLGRGLGGGTQSQLNFIPAQHTDFAYAVLAEKLGLLGAGLVVLLFAGVIWRALLITYRAKDTFGTLLAGGITGMLFIQVTINIGMNLGLLPVTGLPLPLISYGGTNMVMTLLAIGVLQSIAMNRKKLQFEQQ